MSSTKRLTVVFSPWYAQENPYQRELARSLEHLDINVKGLNSSLKLFVFEINKLETNVLHLHWLQGFFLLRVSLVKGLTKLSLLIFQLLRLKASGVKIFWTVHNLKNHEETHVKLDRLGSILTALIAHQLIVHSESAKKEVKKYLFISDNKICVIPHGSYIDVYENSITQKDAQEELSIPNNSVVFLFFGLIQPYKGVLELTKSFHQVHKDAYLVIAGQPKDSILDTHLKAEAQINQRIKYIPGFVAEDKVQTYMNACDAVVLPYKESLTSGAVILAMSFCKACIAPNRGFTAEVLNSQGAFLYDSDVETGLTNALNSAVQHRNQLFEMGQYNYQHAKEWNWHSIAEKNLALYQKHLKNVNY